MLGTKAVLFALTDALDIGPVHPDDHAAHDGSSHHADDEVVSGEALEQAVVGHTKPIYFGFKGGKGVLVAGGAILAIQPILLPVLTVVFLLCLVPPAWCR